MKRVSDLEIDAALRIVRKGGLSTPLTPSENRLLELLAHYRDNVGGGSVPWEYLWGVTPGANSYITAPFPFGPRRKIE
jgi:DNA-binding response OmpR family regulator